MSQSKRGFTLIELLVVIAIIAILASILFPVFAKAREKARQTTCLSQVRQMATAVQMYNQDNNGRFPGVDWCSAVAGYLGDSTKMFFCPSDAANDAESPVSYGYAGILLRADGTGVNEAQIKSPTEVGVVCDAAPSKAYPGGGIVGGGGLRVEADYAVIPTARHSKGVIVGYCDGHAKYVPKDFNEAQMDNATTRAFYQAAGLGLVDNPSGGLGAFTDDTLTAVGGLTFGGEYCAYPLIQAAAEVNKVKGGTYYSRGYLGQLATTGRRSPYVWGEVELADVWGGTFIAQDNLVLIVAKNSKIPALVSQGLVNGTYVAATATVANWANTGLGFVQNSIQIFTMPASMKTTVQAKSLLFPEADISNAVQVANDAEMVDKVANDPYGLGFCSSAFVDTERVTVLTTSGTADDTAWPQPNKKYRWTMPAVPSTGFIAREIYANGDGAGINYAESLNNGELKLALQAGPLFKCSYWK